MRFSPHFQLFYFNELELCEFIEWKIKRINNADLFSQPPLLIFIKGANISGGHCTLLYLIFDAMLKEINTFIDQRRIKLIKSDSKVILLQ